MTGAFVGRRRDRLGARLLTLLNCIRLSKEFGVPYLMDWFPNGADAPELDHPAELFDPDWIARHMVHTALADAPPADEVSLWEFQSDQSPDKLVNALKSGKHVVVDEGFEIVVFPWEDEDDVHALHGTLIGVPDFSQIITDGIAKIDATVSDTRFTGYHFRRGDIIERSPWTHKTWPAKIEIDELYTAHCEKAEGGLRVFFSDSQDALARLSAKATGSKRIDEIVDFGGLTPAQRDFLELYAMSRADVIIAPSISAFSSAAARISGKTRSVFRDVLTLEEIGAAHEQLASRMAEGLQGFSSDSEYAHLYAKLHSYLTAKGRIDEAWRLGRTIADQDCDRAFLPILLGLNEFYLGRWAACEEEARKGLQNPNLWPEDHAVLTALLAAALAMEGKTGPASFAFSRAFWAKPMRPDVVVVGSRLIYREHLSKDIFPQLDWGVLTHLRRERFPPFNNLSLVEHRFIKRRPINFDLVLLDWAELSLDQKARRLSGDRERLTLLRDGLASLLGENIDPHSVASMDALIASYLGAPISDCVAKSSAAMEMRPGNMLLAKRHAELLEGAGEFDGACATYRAILKKNPSDTFMQFYFGLLLARGGKSAQGEGKVLAAAKLNRTSAAIQGAAGQILLRRGDFSTALEHLERANELCPSFKRFQKQVLRARAKLPDR